MRDPRNTRLTWTTAMAALTFATVAAQDAAKPATPAPPAAPAGLAVLWQRSPMPVAGPATLTVSPRSLFLSSSETGLGAYSTDDGRTMWTSNFISDLPAVAVGEQIAVVSGGAIHVLGQDRGLEAWRADVGPGTSALFGLRNRFGAVVGAALRTWAADGTAGWQTALPGVATTRVVLQDDMLIVGVDSPALVALDSATGQVRWQVPLKARPQALTAISGRVFFAAANATLYAYDTGADPKPSWHPFRLIRSIGDPAVDDERVYFSLLDNSVRGFARGGGTQRWSTVMRSRPAAGPMRVGENLAIALSNGVVVELRARDGHVISPAESLKPSNDRLQAVAPSPDGTRVFTFTIAGNNVRTLTAWGHPPAKR